eukprot:14910090-Alexandrium_andersonii.AAC.1
MRYGCRTWCLTSSCDDSGTTRRCPCCGLMPAASSRLWVGLAMRGYGSRMLPDMCARQMQTCSGHVERMTSAKS